METHPGRHVEVGIRVHAREPLQRGHGVEEHVLEIHGKVESGNGGGERQPRRQRQRAEHAPSALGGERGETDRRHR